ncbi:retrovirus-related pol polyprotein from transposon TNT 1-94 [Tanacetum coccineum]
MSKSSGVIHTTSVSRPQLKCYQVKDKVVPNNSQVKFQKKDVEDHHRISSISKKTKSVTACNDSSNSRTSNENAVCADCGTCVFNSNHDACVSRYLKDVNARSKKPNVVPISASKTQGKANKSFSPILGYGDLIQGNVTIKRVYYVEGLNHNLFSVGQFCDVIGALQESSSPTPICFMANASPTQACYYCRTDRGTEFLNKTLHAYFKEEGIEHQTSTPRTPEQTALSKDGTVLLLRLLIRCFQLLSFHYHFGLKQLQPHVILRTDQSSYPLMERRHITS